MKILHITAHLGGGVGKAHSVLCAASSRDVRRHYVLLENPRDMRFVGKVRDAGALVTVVPDSETLKGLVDDADIVQVEWWNHPRLFETLSRADLPPMRTIFWSHVSGLTAPYIPTGLFGIANRFLLTSSCSLAAPNIAPLPAYIARRIGIASSGFGLARPAQGVRSRNSTPPVAYLGTVDFSKLSGEFFDVIDGVADIDFTVSVWGDVDRKAAVASRAADMRHRGRVKFEGHSKRPEQSLANPGIFLYLLRPDHFGTGENALIEAMSLGWAPLVFANPAEAAIVRHEQTGFVEKDLASATRRLSWMLHNPKLVADIGERAASEVARLRSPCRLIETFEKSYSDVLREERKVQAFGRALGKTPGEWFLSTQTPEGSGLPGSEWYDPDAPASKGTFNHFLDCFPADPTLHALCNGQMNRPAARSRAIEAQEFYT